VVERMDAGRVQFEYEVVAGHTLLGRDRQHGHVFIEGGLPVCVSWRFCRQRWKRKNLVEGDWPFDAHFGVKQAHATVPRLDPRSAHVPTAGHRKLDIHAQPIGNAHSVGDVFHGLVAHKRRANRRRRRFVTAAELLPALVPIPAGPGLQSEVWRALEIPDVGAAGATDGRGSASGGSTTADSAGGSGGITIGGATVSMAVAIGGLAAAVIAVVAAVALLGGGDDEPETQVAAGSINVAVRSPAPTSSASASRTRCSTSASDGGPDCAVSVVAERRSAWVMRCGFRCGPR